MLHQYPKHSEKALAKPVAPDDNHSLGIAKIERRSRIPGWVNGDGDVNAGDSSEWRENFGEVAGSGSALSAVPEAPTMFLLIAGAAAVFAGRRRHARQTRLLLATKRHEEAQKRRIVEFEC
jgi:hypothetical protein